MVRQFARNMDDGSCHLERNLRPPSGTHGDEIPAVPRNGEKTLLHTIALDHLLYDINEHVNELLTSNGTCHSFSLDLTYCT